MSQIEVQVGQVWRSGSDEVTIYGREDQTDQWSTCKAGQVDPSDGFVHKGTRCCSRFTLWLKSATLVSAPAPDRSGCKAWCGHRYLNSDVPANAKVVEPLDTEDANQPGWCTALCRDERRPPLPAAAVAETPLAKFPLSSIDSAFAAREDEQKAQPKEAAAPKCSAYACVSKGPVLLRWLAAFSKPQPYCDVHYLAMERIIERQNACGPGLAKSSLPERLAKAKLAHVAGLHDSELVGVR